MIKAKKNGIAVRIDLQGEDVTVEVQDPQIQSLATLASYLEHKAERHLASGYFPDAHAALESYVKELGWEITEVQAPQADADEPPKGAIF